VGDRSGKLCDLPFVGDVRAEAVGDAAVLTNGVHDLRGAVVDVIDRDGQAVPCQPPRHGPGKRAGAAGDESHAPGAGAVAGAAGRAAAGHLNDLGVEHRSRR
jgi:hypothetical protein